MMSKPLPILDQMPWNVKKAIVNSSDNETKTELRRCSKELYEHVKVSKIRVGFFFTLNCGGQLAGMSLYHSTGSFGFYPTANGCRKTTKYGDKVTKIEGGDFISAGVEELMKAFKNQAFHFSFMTMSFDYDPSSDQDKQRISQFTEKMKEGLSKLSHQISVGTLHMFNDCDPDPILAILPHIKPSRKFGLSVTPNSGGFVSRDSDAAAFSFFEIDLSEIAKTEQWKKANSVILKRFRVPVDCPETLCIRSLWVYVPNFSINDAKFIVENITREGGWWDRTISCQNVDESVMEYLGNFRVGQRGQGYDYEVPGVNGVPCYAHVQDWGRLGKKLWFHSYSERPENYYCLD